MKHHYLKLFVCILIILTGCTDRIKFDSLNIEPLLTDIPKECNPINKLEKCIVEINTPCNFDRSKYLAKMLGPNNGNGYKLKNGTLCVPDIDTAVICVYAENGIKHLEMGIKRATISSLKIWDKGQLISEVEGSLGRNMQDGRYYFLSGTQKIYKGYRTIVERTSNYKDGCKEFVEAEKRHVVNEKLSYYKHTQKTYVNYYDGYGTDYYGKTLDYVNYRECEDAKYTIMGVRYEDEDGNQLPIKDILLAESQPYLLFKTSVVKDGKRTYLAIFKHEEYIDFDGIFFNSQDPNSTVTYEHAVDLFFDTADNGKEYCWVNDMNNYEPHSPSFRYELSIDSLGHVMFQYDGNDRFPATSMTYFHAQYNSWLEGVLLKRIEEEKEIRSARYRREREREERMEAINARMIERSCPECGGLGAIAQGGMGVMHGTLSCPRCLGRGTIKVDPYSPY